jgi:SHS2 domain-containing protein
LNPPFEILEHPSDLGIEARGTTLAEAFLHAANGLMSVIIGTSTIEARDRRVISLQALDRENLFVRWLSEILFLYDAEKFLTADAEFTSITETSLNATVIGQQYDASTHELKLDVKAITYHHLLVEKDGDIWRTRVFVDI